MKTSVVATLKGEPQARVDQMIAAVAGQTGGPYELVLALPSRDRSRLRFPADVVLVHNPSGGRSPGLNAAVDAASGDLICRIDARSIPPTDYVERTSARLEKDASVGVVGGVQRPVAADGGVLGRGIARALANPWALGGASYRRGGGGPVDTVYLGSYRKSELQKLGGFDERLHANEDFELCLRYQRAGLAVWLEDGLFVGYEARASMSEVWRQYLAFGRSKVRFWRATGERPNARQAIAMGGAAATVVAGAALGVWRPRALVPLTACATAIVSLVDHLGGGPESDVRVRATACAAYAPIFGGWLCGVAAESVRRSPASARARPSPTLPSPDRRLCG